MLIFVEVTTASDVDFIDKVVNGKVSAVFVIVSFILLAVVEVLILLVSVLVLVSKVFITVDFMSLAIFVDSDDVNGGKEVVVAAVSDE